MDEYNELRDYFSKIDDDATWTGLEVKDLVRALLDLAEFERGSAVKRQELHARFIKSLRQEGR